MKPTMNNQEFTKVINCLPDGFTWGSALTPAIALHIINAARAAQKNEELFAIYKLCNQLVAYIGAFGEIKQSNSIVNQMMDALYDLDVGNVAKRANDLIEKAFMPRDQALKLAVNEYIIAAKALPTQLSSNPLQLHEQEPESKWISVDDRLPDDTGTRYKVFAICKKKIETKDVNSPYFNKGIIGVYQDWNIRQWPENFTHWMHLPLLTKE